MNTVFVSFQGVHPDGRSWGMVRVLEPVLDSMAKAYPYFVSHAPSNYKSFIRVAQAHQIFSKLVWAIGIRLKIHVGLLRYIQERSFDFFITRKLQYPCLLVSTAIIPTAARRNFDAGGVNIFIAGNPYDDHINRILERESAKYNIKISNAYTFRPRLKFIKEFLNQQNEIISQTDITQKSFLGKFPKAKITLIPYELMPDRKIFQDLKVSKHKTVTFIYAASTVWLKGLTYLIDAWNILGETKARLVIAGPVYPDVLRAIEGKISKEVEFIGFVPAAKLNTLYRESHVCIVPSLLDNHPATISEAMYCELPVITTEGCGSRNLVLDGKTGFIVPSGDADSLAQKIQWFLEHPDLAIEMGQSAKATIETIAYKDQSSKLAAVINQRTY